jgi:hypothetical protein
MNQAVKLLLSQPPAIPNNRRANLLSWHKRRNLPPVFYGLTSLGTNMSFESDATGWTVGDVAASISTERARTGSKAVKLNCAASSGFYRQEIAASSGNIIFASVWIYLTEYTSGTSTIRCYDGNTYNNAVIGNLNPALLNQWQRVSVVKTATAAGIRLLVGATSSDTKVAYLDDAQAHNLTAIFGSGLEPTAAEMDAILTADGTAYWDGTRQVLCNPLMKYFWYDSSGNGRHAKMANLGYVANSNLDAQFGFSVDGVDDGAIIADSAGTRLTGGGTLCAWIYPKSLGETGGRIFDKSTDTSGQNGYIFIISQPNAGAYNIRAIINNGIPLAGIENCITFNKWQFASVRFSSTGRALFINGVNVTASGGSETALPPDVAGVVTIGNRAGATDRTFNGYIDDDMIFNVPLTDNEIRQMYQATRREYSV